jgi:hypothetical protein
MEWDGRQWQDYCLRLLRVRHANHQLQEVPDRHKGDLGIEAFTHEGTLYQCYAAQEPLSVQDRYEKQRDKLTEDIGKLKSNELELARLLGQVRVTRYVFMVPRYDSRHLIAHAQTKATEVRSWGLPFIDEVFTITVETDDSYSAERDQVFSIPDPLLNVQPASPEETTAWGDDHPDLLDDARDKLVGIGLKGSSLTTYLDTLVGAFLSGENALDSLRSKFPDSWEAVRRTVSGRERTLALDYPSGSAEAPGDVRGIAASLADLIRQAAPPLPAEVAHDLAWATVADWILRCPLDFEEAS